MTRDTMKGSVSRQTLVVREEGNVPTHFVSGLLFEAGWYLIGRLLGADSLALSIARST
jgi:hypothetical protein